jgi:hypothetical protein
VRIYQTTHPSEAEQDRERWAQEVTDGLNVLLRGHGVLASGAVSPTELSNGHGITSVTDHGTGDWSVAFDTVPDMPYHVSVDVRGNAHVVEKTTLGFRVKTSEGDQPVDTDFGFAVIGRHAKRGAP